MRTLRIGLLALTCAWIAGPASAAVFSVDSNADAVDATPGDGLCATGTGACTLRAAVIEANALAGADEIDLPAGVYTLALPGVSEDAAASGDLDVTGDLTIQGDGLDVSVIDAAGLDRGIDVVPSSATVVAVTLRDLTIRRGHDAVTAPETGTLGGGGIRANFPTNLALSQVALRDDVAATRGGGLACFFSHCTISGGVVAGNAAINGGGLWGGENGRLAVDGTELTDNTATLGAAIGAVDVGSGLDLRNARIAGNHGSSAIEKSESTASIADCVIEDNEATGIATNNDVGLTVTRSVIRGNVGAAGGGMRLAFFGGGGGSIVDSAIYDNESLGAGGGLLLPSESFVAISNTTIGGNRAAAAGGGIALSVSAGSLQLNNVTITDNHAPESGGVALESDWFETPVQVANSIVAQNHGDGGDCVVSGDSDLVRILSGGYNLVGDASGCADWIVAAGDQLGSAAAPIDAKLGPLTAWGVPMLVHPPLPGSPAIDAGNPAAPSNTYPACLPADQRGKARPINGDGVGNARCDIGAFEKPRPASGGCGLGAELVLVLAALRVWSRQTT